MITPRDVAAAKEALGAQLAALRHAVGSNQHVFAKQVFTSRSSIANIERGRQLSTRDFWQRCDEVLHAGGALVRGYDELRALEAQQQRETADAIAAKRATKIHEAFGVRSELVDGDVAQLPAGSNTPSEGLDFADHREGRRVAAGSAQDEPDDFDLWELDDVLGVTRTGGLQLAAAEASCARLDERYAELSPQVALPRVRVQLHKVVRVLDRCQPGDRSRLCTVAGRLAGLRAWLLFDLADHQAADAWYDAAIRAAQEAEDHALYGWLFGARSLIPTYQHDHRTALAFIEQGQAAAARSAGATVNAWLHALEARARAGLRDRTGFRTAQRRAERLVSRTSVADRRHGMDFDGDTLDLTYYSGTSLLLLHQPGPAAEFLQRSLDTLPPAHAKAQAILLLGMATGAAQRRRVDEASELACQALTIARGQPIMPILQRARDLRSQLGPRKASALASLDERLEDFARALSVPEPRPQA